MGALFRNVIYPAYHWAKRDGLNRARIKLERNQWLSMADLTSIQEQKLARLLSFAKQNVPYYRSLLRDLDTRPNRPITVNEIRDIPPLTKSIIRREQGALVSEDLSENKIWPNSTSGSTGEPTRFFTDLRSTQYRKAAGLRSNSWTGWQLGDRHVSLWGAPIDEKGVTRFRGKLHGLVSARRYLSSFELSESRMDEYIESIRRFKPVLLIAYPGPLEQFAVHCRKRGAAFPTLKGIVSSAETLWPHQRAVAEEAFCVRVFDRYGSREVGQIGSECEAQMGLHISVDRLLVEVTDELGQACQPGKVGRILVTDLDNFGMPLIRYDIGDRATRAKEERCSCGRGLPLIEKVEGRSMDMIHTPDGRKIGGTFWTQVLRSRPGLKQFQVIQQTLDGVVINFVPDTTFDSELLGLLADTIHDHCGNNFVVEFSEKETIDLTVSGKQRLIICELAREYQNV